MSMPKHSSGSYPSDVWGWSDLRLVDRLYHSAREIYVGLDLNDPISRRYGLGPTGIGGRFDNPSDGPEADGILADYEARGSRA
jgi:hypothetical protein